MLLNFSNVFYFLYPFYLPLLCVFCPSTHPFLLTFFLSFLFAFSFSPPSTSLFLFSFLSFFKSLHSSLFLYLNNPGPHPMFFYFAYTVPFPFSVLNFPFSLYTSPHIYLSPLPSVLSLHAHPSSLGGVRKPLEWEKLAVLINTPTSKEWREAVEGKQWQQCWRKMSQEVGKGFVLAEQKHLFCMCLFTFDFIRPRCKNATLGLVCGTFGCSQLWLDLPAPDQSHLVWPANTVLDN